MPPPWGPPRTQENSRRLSSVGTTSVDCSPPDSGNLLLTLEAGSAAAEPVVEDSVADPPNQGGLAAGAARVLVASHPAGQVSGIDVLEAGLLANPGGPQERLRRGVVR